MKSSTCHIGQEQLAKPAMLPSSCGKATTCLTQLLEGWPRHKAGDAVAPVAKSVEDGQGGRGSQDWHGDWECTAWALVVDGGKGGEADVRRRGRGKKVRREKNHRSSRAGRDKMAVEKFKQERFGGEK